MAVTYGIDIGSIGGQNIPTDDAGFARAPVMEFRSEVNNATIAAGQVRFIASGEEFAYQNLTVNGYEYVNGGLYCNNLTVGAGGKVVVGAGGEIVQGAFL